MPQNKAIELEHAKKILHHPEFYWNSGTAAGNRGSRRRAQWIIDTAGLAPGVRVLEIGCGTGYFSELFLASGASLSAIELSPDLLRLAVRRCGAAADFREADVEHLPYGDATFDAVVGVRVLHHLDMDSAVAEMHRVLKPRGAFAFCEPNMMNPQIAIQKNIPLIKRWMGDTPDETAFFKWRLRRFLSLRGFEDIAIEPFDFLHPHVPAAMVTAVERIGGALEKIPLVREIAGSLAIFARKAGGA